MQIGSTPKKIDVDDNITVGEALRQAGVSTGEVDGVKVDGRQSSLKNKLGSGSRITAVPKIRGG